MYSLVQCDILSLSFSPPPANNDKSNLYLKMFKLVFGSVQLFAQENELMLKVCAMHCIITNTGNSTDTVVVHVPYLILLLLSSLSFLVSSLFPHLSLPLLSSSPSLFISLSLSLSPLPPLSLSSLPPPPLSFSSFPPLSSLIFMK